MFLDGDKGWAIKQKDGTIYHVSQEVYQDKMLRELNHERPFKKLKHFDEEDFEKFKALYEKIKEKEE